jgi:hypothetical protein
MNPIEWLAINGSERGNQTLIPNSSDSILEINVALMSCRKCLKKEREDHDREIKNTRKFGSALEFYILNRNP